MQDYKQQFKGKKITVMGLGILRRGLGYTKFLAECGADLIVTDLKTKEQLKASVEEITNYELRIKNNKRNATNKKNCIFSFRAKGKSWNKNKTAIARIKNQKIRGKCLWKAKINR